MDMQDKRNMHVPETQLISGSRVMLHLSTADNIGALSRIRVNTNICVAQQGILWL